MEMGALNEFYFLLKRSEEFLENISSMLLNHAEIQIEI